MAVTISVIVTGNHYVLDVVGGLAVALPAAAVAAVLAWDDLASARRDLSPGRLRPAG